MTTITLKTLQKKYPTSKEGKHVTLSEEGRAAVKTILKTREKKSLLEATEKAAKTIILAEMKDAESADAGTHTVWVKSREANTFDIEAFKDKHEALYEEFLAVIIKRPIEVKVKADE